MKEDRLQLRINAKLKAQAERLAKNRHMTLSGFVTQLLQQAVETGHLEARTNGRAKEVEQF